MDYDPPAGGAPEFDAATTNFMDALKPLLVQDGLELDRRTIKLIGTDVGESYKARRIEIEDSGRIVIIEQPDTDDYTCRTLLIKLNHDKLLYSAYIEVLRNRYEKHQAAELARLMREFDQHLDEGEAMGLIDKSEVAASRQLRARLMRESLDRLLIAAEIDLLGDDSQALEQEVDRQRDIEQPGRLGLQYSERLAVYGRLQAGEVEPTPEVEAWYRKYQFYKSQESLLLLNLRKHQQSYAEQFEEQRAKTDELIAANDPQLCMKAPQVWTIIKLLDAVKTKAL